MDVASDTYIKSAANGVGGEGGDSRGPKIILLWNMIHPIILCYVDSIKFISHNDLIVDVCYTFGPGQLILAFTSID